MNPIKEFRNKYKSKEEVYVQRATDQNVSLVQVERNV